MDFGRLLQSVEDAVYEVMVWLLLLPKTLFLSMFRPRVAMKYVFDEWEKKPDERFDEYLSPVLLWLLVSVIPLSLLAILGSTEIKSFEEFSSSFSKNLLPMTSYAMLVPFTYIVWMEWVNKRPVKKSTLKRSFYLHCYALAPAQLIFALFALLALVNPFFILGSLLVLPLYEGFIFQTDLEISYMKAFLYAFVPQLFLAVLAFIIIGNIGSGA
jgi:hypothetical protein